MLNIFLYYPEAVVPSFVDRMPLEINVPNNIKQLDAVESLLDSMNQPDSEYGSNMPRLKVKQGNSSSTVWICI